MSGEPGGSHPRRHSSRGRYGLVERIDLESNDGTGRAVPANPQAYGSQQRLINPVVAGIVVRIVSA